MGYVTIGLLSSNYNTVGYETKKVQQFRMYIELVLKINKSAIESQNKLFFIHIVILYYLRYYLYVEQ